ncbi:MAG: hypothetical protein IH623_08985 [Verrucomicrobia bacterium]|nr:hypothetical protein [Verrucomicrobiota bacterium]
MKKSFSDSLIALLAFFALLLAILLGWQSWNHARLKIEVAFAEEQTRIFEQMRQQAIGDSASGVAESLAYVVNYYPSGTKQREGSRLDSVVERMRSCAIRDIIAQLRQKTGEDLGEKPEAWIEKHANTK